MRLEIGRLLSTALAGLALAGASACGQAGPGASASPAISASASAGAGDAKAVCEAVTKARATALDAFAPVSKTLARDDLSVEDIGKAIDALEIAFNAIHFEVAVAAENTSDPQLKAKLAAYRLSVEEAIVAIEGADGDKTKLAAVVDLPALREAEQAVMAACAPVTR